MDSQDMIMFLTIAQHENLTRAAEELGVTQPHLTRRLKRMEQQLGVQLFTREKKRLHITKEGSYLMRQCRQMLQFEEKTVAQLHEMSEGTSGRIYIGAIETASTVYLPEWIEGFSGGSPKVSYHIWTANTEDVIERLRRHLIDIALIRTAVSPDRQDAQSHEGHQSHQYGSIRIATERWTAVVSAENPLCAKDGDITLEDLSRERLIVPTTRCAEIRQGFEKAGLPVDIFCEFSPLMNALVLVEKNLGVAILPESALANGAGRGLVAKPLCEETLSEVRLIWRNDGGLSAAERNFIAYIKDRQAGHESRE